MDTMTLAYLAGVVDSDGHIAIKRRRTGSGGWTYHACIQVKQAEVQAVTLAKATFGGNLRLNPPAAPTRRPMHCWQITHQGAVRAAKAMLPYLMIKREQAAIVIDYGKKMQDVRLRRRSHWFKFQPDDAMLTPSQVAASKGIDRDSIYQAIRNGSIPVVRNGRQILVPARFMESYTIKIGQHPLPLEYIAMRESMWQQCKHLNRVGPR